jgi:hypothetical protein
MIHDMFDQPCDGKRSAQAKSLATTPRARDNQARTVMGSPNMKPPLATERSGLSAQEPAPDRPTMARK